MTVVESHRQHGTYVKYVQDRCRCAECRQANGAYERERRSRVEPPYVAAATARAHLAELRTVGVGLKTVAKVSGVSHGALTKLVYGDRTRGRGPSKRIRRTTHERILAVTPSAATGTSKVAAAPTRALLDEMIAAGIPKSRIAEALGATSPGLQVARRPMVDAKTATAVAVLHARWVAGEWNPVRRDRHGNTYRPDPPPPSERGRADVSDLYLELADIIDERRAQAEWRQSAACRGRSPWMWFPNRGDHETHAAAILICRSCIVREQCRTANFDQPDGIFGALSARARTQLRGEDIPVPVPVASKCGTNAGYHRHIRRNEPACDECRLAHAHYEQDRAPRSRLSA